MLRRVLLGMFPIDRYSRRDRVVIGLLWMVGVAHGLAQSHASATVPFVRAGLGMTEAQMSLVLAVARLGGVGALLYARPGDRRGRRRPFLSAYTLLILASVGTAAVVTPWQYAAFQTLVRLAATAAGTLAVVLVAEQVPAGVRAFSISLYTAGGSFGAGLSVAMLPLATLGPEGWRLPFAVSAVGLVPLGLLASRLGESPVYARMGDPSRAPVSELVRSPYAPVFWVASAAGLAAAMLPAVGLAFSTERLISDLGLPTGTAVVITLAGGTAGGTGLFVGGRLADAWGRKPATILALVLMLGGGLTLYRLADPVWLGVVVAVSTFGSLAYVPAAASHRTELFPTRLRATAGTAGTYLATVGSAAGLGVGALTLGRIGLTDTITLLGVAPLVAIALTALLPETRGQALDRVQPRA